jgi:hypothetical protein
MAAAPVIATPLAHRSISTRKLEANRRNAKRSTGPRTMEGKARVARNALKHGFFASIEHWTDEARAALDEILEGLRDEFKPTEDAEDRCVATMAIATVHLAMALRYESGAAFKHHLKCERDLKQRIASAEPARARHLEAQRDALKAAGLWCPTLPDARTMSAILRYQGSLERMRTRAYSTLRDLQEAKRATHSLLVNHENAKTNPPHAAPRFGSENDGRPPAALISRCESAKTNPPQREQPPPSSNPENAKTNPPNWR